MTVINLNAIPSIFETTMNKSEDGNTGYHLIRTRKDIIGSSYAIGDV